MRPIRRCELEAIFGKYLEEEEYTALKEFFTSPTGERLRQDKGKGRELSLRELRKLKAGKLLDIRKAAILLLLLPV